MLRDDAALVAVGNRAGAGMERLDHGVTTGVEGRYIADLRDHARDPAAGVRPNRRRAPSVLGGAGSGRFVAQDRCLQHAQVRRWLDPEALDERAAGAAVGGERVRLAAGAIEGEHMLAPQSLVQGVLLGQARRLARGSWMSPTREVGLEPVAQAAEASILEPRDRRLSEARRGDVRERRAPPQRQRLAQRRGRLRRIAARGSSRPARARVFEAIDVERAGRYVERVSPAGERDRLLAHRCAQP